MKSTFYTYELGNAMRDDEKQMTFGILVHGFDVDIRGHVFDTRNINTTNFMYDPESPFILIPNDLLIDAVRVYGGDIISATPAIGDFNQSVKDDYNEGINRTLSETYKMMMEFDIAHKMYGSGDRITMISENRETKPIRETYTLTWDEKDTCLDLKTKEVTVNDAVEDIYKYLRPIQTTIGTCYECDAIVISGWSSSITSRLYSLREEDIENHAETIFGLALHRYPCLWDEFASRHADILAKHAEEIFDRNVDPDEIDSDYVVNDLRLVLKDAITKCLKDSTKYVDRAKEFAKLIDSIDDSEIYKLAKEDYKESLRHIEDKFIAADSSITQEIMSNRIDKKIDAYRSGGLREVFLDEEDYYYDI